MGRILPRHFGKGTCGPHDLRRLWLQWIHGKSRRRVIYLLHQLQDDARVPLRTDQKTAANNVVRGNCNASASGRLGDSEIPLSIRLVEGEQACWLLIARVMGFTGNPMFTYRWHIVK